MLMFFSVFCFVLQKSWLYCCQTWFFSWQRTVRNARSSHKTTRSVASSLLLQVSGMRELIARKQARPRPRPRWTVERWLCKTASRWRPFPGPVCDLITGCDGEPLQFLNPRIYDLGFCFKPRRHKIRWKSSAVSGEAGSCHTTMRAIIQMMRRWRHAGNQRVAELMLSA